MIDKNLRYLVVINIPEGLRIMCSKLINAEDIQIQVGTVKSKDRQLHIFSDGRVTPGKWYIMYLVNTHPTRKGDR